MEDGKKIYEAYIEGSSWRENLPDIHARQINIAQNMMMYAAYSTSNITTLLQPTWRKG